MLVISRIYTEGSLVCLKTVLISQRTWTRIDIRMFYHVSAAYSDYPFHTQLIVTLSPWFWAHPCGISWNLIGWTCHAVTAMLWPSHPAVLLFFQMMLPEWCSRARRTTSMRAASRWTSLLSNRVSCLCLTFNVNSSFVCCVYVFVCLLGGAPSVWCTFMLCCSSGSLATDLHSLLADCLGATDTHHHHAYNFDREGTGIHTSTCSYSKTVNSYTPTAVKMSKQWGKHCT